VDLSAALKLGIRVGLDEIPAGEFQCMLVLEDERTAVEKERIEARTR
jgi:hypothetical protein